jgi:hypothetical protein
MVDAIKEIPAASRNLSHPFFSRQLCFSYSGRAEWSDYGQLTDDNAPGLMLNRHIK